MWFTFAVACAACACIVYIPGYLVLRFAGMKGLASLLLGPVITLACYGATGIIAQKMGVAISADTLIAIPIVLAVIILAIRKLLGSRKDHASGGSKGNSEDGSADQAPSGTAASLFSWMDLSWKTLAFYVIFGLAISFVEIIYTLNGPDSFIMAYDNPHHLNLIRSMSDTGNFSVLATNSYPDVTMGERANSSAFYPALYHVIGAMIVQIMHVTPALAENAVNTSFTVFVFSGSMYFFLSAIFKDKRCVLIGVFMSFAFIGFPWALIWGGPVYPNAIAMMAAPLTAGVVVGSLSGQLAKPREFVLPLILVVCGAFGLFCLHPNTIFMLIVLLTPYLTIWLYRRFADSGRPKQWTACLAFLLFVVCIWVIALNLPMMQSTVNYVWNPDTTPTKAIYWILGLRFKFSGYQILLGIITLIGLIAALRKPATRWIGIAYIIFALFVYIDLAVAGPIRAWFTGFWYTDTLRTGACLSFCGIPLACMGLDWVARTISRLFDRNRKKAAASDGAQEDRSPKNVQAAYLAVCAVFLVVNFFPFSIPGIPSEFTPFCEMRRSIASLHHGGGHAALDDQEKEFLSECASIIREDAADSGNGSALVLNYPCDGSAFGYSMYDVPVYYRTYDTNVSPSMQEVLDDISSYASNEAVQKTLRTEGIEYVILLDADSGAASETEGSYAFNDEVRSKIWSGLDSIHDDTPGFELVLSDGDMRLYRLVPTNDL